MEISLWSDIDQFAGTVVRTAFVYVATLLAVRIAGRRTLAQLSAFDVIVTIALGSLAAGAALPSDPSLLDFVGVLLTFLAMQVVIGAFRQRFRPVRSILDFPPRVIAQDGDVSIRNSLWSAQITRDELESRLRQAGVGDLGAARVVVLEPTGKVSVTTEAEIPTLFKHL